MKLYFQEFWFTAVTSFLYFTAFTAQLAEYSGVTDKTFQYWYDAQVAAGVSQFCPPPPKRGFELTYIIKLKFFNLNPLLHMTLSFYFYR